MTKVKNNFQDWFGRSADEAFTFFDNNSKMLNWEVGYKSYSDYLLGTSNSNTEAARLIGSMFSVLRVPKSINYSNKLSRDSIMLPTDLLNNEKHPEIDESHRNDAFLGASLRNGALASFENASNYEQIINTKMQLLKAEEYGKTDAETISDLLTTVLTDERMDRKISVKYPGYSRFIQKYKDYKFNHCYTPQEFEHDYEEFFDLILRMIQFPATVEDELLEKYDKHIKEVREIMNQHGGIPESHSNVLGLSEELSTYISKMIEEMPPSESESDSESDDGEGNEGGDDSSESKSTKDSSAVNEGLSKLAQISKSYAEQILSEEDNDSESSDDPILDEIKQNLEEMGYGENNLKTSVRFHKVEENKTRYKILQNRIDLVKANVISTLLKRKNRDYKFSIKGMRSGRLDTNKLVEAKQKVPTIYERMGEVKTDKLNIVILIDESGSMSWNDKIVRAAEAAIFLNEAFSKQPDVELFIYGHTADLSDKSTDIFVYREPGIKKAYGLSTCTARSNNRDGVAIYETAKRVRKFTNNPVVMLVISDGEPAAYGYNDTFAIEHTRKMVLKAEAMNMQVIQIAIDSVKSNLMFTNYVKMTDMKTFPSDLVNYLKRKVNRMIKEKITVS